MMPPLSPNTCMLYVYNVNDTRLKADGFVQVIRSSPWRWCT